jgi:hypothetical protein
VFPGCTLLLLLRLAVLTALLLPRPPLTPLQVLCWDAGTYLWDPVLAAIVALFRQLDDFEEERQAAAAALLSGAPPPLPLLMDAEQQQKRAVIDPTPLREALNALPGQEFKMGEQWRRGLTGGLLACCCDGWLGACGGFLTAEWHCCCCCWLLCVCGCCCRGKHTRPIILCATNHKNSHHRHPLESIDAAVGSRALP